MTQQREINHFKDNEDIFTRFETTKSGLNSNEAIYRLNKYGKNTLIQKGKKSLFVNLLMEFKDTMVIVLIIAATISLLSGEKTDALIIYTVVLLNGIIGFIQKVKAEKAMEALKKMVSPSARVIREEKQIIIDTDLLVPGDILVLSEGDIISADAILFENHELQTEEAILTGESTPIQKIGVETNTPFTQIIEENKLFKGTTVSKGNGLAIVTKTGMETEFGKIAGLTQKTKKDLSPLEKEINHIGRFSLKIIIIITAIIFCIEILLNNSSIIKTLLLSVSIAVAAIPEGLPATITIALALGVQRLSKKNIIIKKLQAVETLGATTVICTDKTGTLTQNKMTAVNLLCEDVFLEISEKDDSMKNNSVTIHQKNSDPIKLSQKENSGKEQSGIKNAFEKIKWPLEIGVICNNSKIKIEKNGEKKTLGDPTETALLTMAEKLGIEVQSIEDKYEKIVELPFDSERKIMTQIAQDKKTKKIYAFTKGAPDSINDICDQKIRMGKASIFRKEEKKEMMENAEFMAKKSLRTLAFAFKEISQKDLDKIKDEKLNNKIALIEQKMTYCGMTGIMDPPRPDVKKSIELTKKAGIKTYILTGDHGLAASCIAAQIGLIEKAEDAIIITGKDILEMSKENLMSILKNKDQEMVFARISPAQKLQIVSILKELKEVVAVTGDGVNDAPALKRADIGIAMGQTGTDVTKETAEMVLSNDSFSSIVNAIEEGRVIYDNIKKFIHYVFSSNIGELFTIFICIIIGLSSPLTAILILTVNLLTDLFPALALGMEPGEKDIMKKAPRKTDQKIMNGAFFGRILFIGCSMGIIMIALYSYIIFSSNWQFGTIINKELYEKSSAILFLSLVFAQIANSFNSKSEKRSIFKINPLKNKWLIYANLTSISIAISIVYYQPLKEIFKTSTPNLMEWLLILSTATTIILIEEIRKFIINKKHVERRCD